MTDRIDLESEKRRIGRTAVTNCLERDGSDSSRSFTEDLVREIERRPEVLTCFATTGQADYHMHVLFPDIVLWLPRLFGYQG